MWCWEGCDGREGCGVGSMLTSTVETITLAPIIFLYCYFVHLNIFQ